MGFLVKICLCVYFMCDWWSLLLLSICCMLVDDTWRNINNCLKGIKLFKLMNNWFTPPLSCSSISNTESPNNVKIGAQCCSNEENMKFAKLLGEFQDVFAWSYEDLHGFDHALIQHSIPIKEGIKIVRKK